MARGKLSTWQSIAYVAPIAPMAILHAPALSILPALYVKHASVSLAVMGSILIASRLIDALTDPMIGILSDRTKSRFGRRRPWIFFGGIFSMIGMWFWFNPSPESGWLWFLLASLAVSLGWTMVEVPHGAWLNDVTSSYDDRARLVSLRMAASLLGYVIFMTAPLWPIFGTDEMTPEVTQAVSWMVLILIPITIGATLASVPRQRQPPMSSVRAGLRDFASSAILNRPFQILAAIMLFSYLASGMVAALYFFYIDSYLGILDRIAWIGLAVAGASLLSTLFWPLAIERLDKHRALAICEIAVSVALLAMFFIQPGHSAFPKLLITFALAAVFSVGSGICITAINTDVVDFDELQTGTNKAGNFFALIALFEKMGLGFGGGLALAAIGAIGFNLELGGEQRAMPAFFVILVAIPIMLHLIAAVMAWQFPIDRKGHQEIELALIERRRSVGPN